MLCFRSSRPSGFLPPPATGIAILPIAWIDVPGLPVHFSAVRAFVETLWDCPCLRACPIAVVVPGACQATGRAFCSPLVMPLKRFPAGTGDNRAYSRCLVTLSFSYQVMVILVHCPWAISIPRGNRIAAKFTVCHAAVLPSVSVPFSKLP